MKMLRPVFLVAALALALPTSAPAAAPLGEVAQFSLPSPSSQPEGITAGADGRVWFTEFSAKNITGMDPLTATPSVPGFTQVALVAPASTNPSQITPGPGTSLWFTEILGAGRVGTYTGGAILEWNVPAGIQNPFDIVAGPDGNIWFTGYGNQTLSWIDPGTFAFRPTAVAMPNPNPAGIAVGPDNKLWVAAYGSNGNGETISRVGTDGTVEATFSTPTTDSGPWDIVTGPDGALWFTEENASRIGRITTSGQITEYPLPSAGVEPRGIAVGPDGALWFTEYLGNRIGRITTSGQITEYPLPDVNPLPQKITAGADGNMWFTQFGNGKIGRIGTAQAPDPSPSPSPSPSPGPSPSPVPAASISVSSVKVRVTRRGAYITSTAKTSAAGKIAQAATTGARKKRTWCKASKTAAAGSFKIKCNLGKKGRSYLRRKPLRLTLTTRLVPATGTAVSTSRKLTVKRKR